MEEAAVTDPEYSTNPNTHFMSWIIIRIDCCKLDSLQLVAFIGYRNFHKQ